MNNFQKKYIQLASSMASQFDARNIRERALIACLVAAVIINLWLFLFHDHLTTAQQKLDIQLSTLKQKINTIDKQYTILVKAKRDDPDRDLKKRLIVAQQHIDKLDAQLQLKMKGLILPTQMAKILEQVLSQQTNLHFKRIQSLAAKPLLVKTPENISDNNGSATNTTNSDTQAIEPAEFTDIGVYQHGIEMEFSGSYIETLSYLKQLKQLPWNFYWDDVLFDVVNYPKSSIIIRVHTLSLKEGWLGV